MLSSRRDFIKKIAIAASTAPFIYGPLPSWAQHTQDDLLDVHIFSKLLQFLDFEELGEIAAETGFAGIDLTVRPKGHVLPESVATKIPEAIKAIEKGGSKVEMITTRIARVDNPLDTDVIQAAAQAGVKYYRSDWFKYIPNKSLPESLEVYQKQVKKLGKFNQKHGIVGCYQNHAGTKVGASFWEIKELLATVNPDFFGTQYDIRHAVAEGGHSWVNGLQLLREHVKTIVLKDFKWGKVDGKWKVINVPIGEGMVDFDRYFKLLKKYNLKPPVSLHVEYPLGGAEHGDRDITVDKKVVFEAMKKDLTAIQQYWQNA